jgi:PPOX class probable FMN-dependent enzyme
MTDQLPTNGTVDSQDDLREMVGEPMYLATLKEQPSLDHYTREFINRSPFLVMASVSDKGHVDVSPRGDPAGFVRIVDDNTLILPDRRGNRRVDTMTNILENPQVGLIFFLPGYEETLRIRGRASLTRDTNDLADMEVNQKTPELGIRVAIDTVFYHCAKALKRSRLWDPETVKAAEGYPKYAQIVRDQRMPEKSVEEIDDFIQTKYREELY